MIALSYSGMKDLRCPFRFHSLKVAKSYKEPVTDILEIGSTVADILAEYRRHCYRSGMSSDLSFFDSLQIDRHVERIGELIDSFKASEFATVPINATELHVESQPVLEYEKIGGFSFDENLDFIGHHKGAWLGSWTAFRLKSDFCYVSDSIDRTLHIIDDKTGFGDGDEQQLAIYALLIHSALQLDDVTNIVGTFNNIAKRTTTRYEFSVSDLEQLRKTIMNAIQDVNTRTEWPAIACDRCGFCSVPGCPVRDGVTTAIVASPNSPCMEIPSSIETREQAEKALLFLQFAEGIADRIMDLLREYVSVNGQVSVAGKVAKFTEKESMKPKDLAQLAAALVSLGAPRELVWHHMNLTKSGLEKIVSKANLADKWPWIEPYLTRSTSHAFGIQNDKTF